MNAALHANLLPATRATPHEYLALEPLAAYDAANTASAAVRRDVLAQMDDAVLALDTEGRLDYLNPAAERQYGRRAADVLGELPDALFRELWSDSAACDRHHRELAALGSSRTHTVHQRHDGVALDVESTVSLLRDAAGRVTGSLRVIRDVSERVRAEATLRESQARLQFTLDAARVGEWEVDLATDVARHSMRHDRCFGYTAPAPRWGIQVMLGHVHPDDRPLVSSVLERAIARHEDYHFECRVVWPDGSVHWIEAHGNLYGQVGTPRRMLGIVVDITERKRAAEALHHADRRKDEFLATLAHELRNPLAPIRHSLETIRLSNDWAVRDKARHVIERQLRQLVHLVDDLMDISRISRGKLALRRERTDLATILQAAIETSRPQVEAGQHRLSVRLPPAGVLRVDADVTRLSQVVANLLDNAAKYTPEGGHIDLQAWRDGDWGVVSVRDTGVGLPADALPRVFEMFAQVNRTLARAQGGLGVGLALVRRLVEMHGGTVEADSPGVGQGCRFTVRVPLTPDSLPAPPVAAPQPSPAAGEDGLRVMVVDDNVDSADSLSQLLQLLGYRTAVAHDGLEAVAMAEQFRPRVALLDIGLPGITGHEVARRIRAQPGGEDMLLLAVSGWGQDTDRQKSREAGFDHHFVKPLDLEALMSLLEPLKR